MMMTQGETGAVKSTIQPIKPSYQEIGTHTKHMITVRIAIGAALVLGALGGQTLTNDGMKNRTVLQKRSWITCSSLMETTVSTQGSHSVFGGENQAEYADLEHAFLM